MEKVYVYVLIDPITLKVRYIGITKSPKRRLQGHLDDIKSNREKNTHKKNWIKKLIKIGCKPIMKILKICANREEALLLEEKLIFKYKDKHNLVNQIVDSGKFNNKSSEKNLSKKLYCYSFDGTFIKEYNMVKEAMKDLNIGLSGITKCLSGEIKSTHGYQFTRIFYKSYRDLNNISKDNWFELFILNTKTNVITRYKNIREASNLLKVKPTGTSIQYFLSALNYKYGNKYQVKINNKWTQSYYYNTGVFIQTKDNLYKFKTKKELLSFMGYKTKAVLGNDTLLKYIHKHFKNIIQVEFYKPLCEVIHIE